MGEDLFIMPPFRVTLGKGYSICCMSLGGHSLLYSHLSGSLRRLACLFLKRGADSNALDSDGKDVLSIAIEAANADIVTL